MVLPKRFTDNNMTDLGSGMCPLIECPCTDRIEIKVKTPDVLTSNSQCKTNP